MTHPDLGALRHSFRFTGDITAKEYGDISRTITRSVLSRWTRRTGNRLRPLLFFVLGGAIGLAITSVFHLLNLEMALYIESEDGRFHQQLREGGIALAGLALFIAGMLTMAWIFTGNIRRMIGFAWHDNVNFTAATVALDLHDNGLRFTTDRNDLTVLWSATGQPAVIGRHFVIPYLGLGFVWVPLAALEDRAAIEAFVQARRPA